MKNLKFFGLLFCMVFGFFICPLCHAWNIALKNHSPGKVDNMNLIILCADVKLSKLHHVQWHSPSYPPELVPSKTFKNQVVSVIPFPGPNKLEDLTLLNVGTDNAETILTDKGFITVYSITCDNFTTMLSGKKALTTRGFKYRVPNQLMPLVDKLLVRHIQRKDTYCNTVETILKDGSKLITDMNVSESGGTDRELGIRLTLTGLKDLLDAQGYIVKPSRKVRVEKAHTGRGTSGKKRRKEAKAKKAAAKR
jgi:hypothetical protein